jgi:hypothetical protein
MTTAIKHPTPIVELQPTASNALAQAFQDGGLIILSIGKRSWNVSVDKQLLGITTVPDNVDLGKLKLLPPEPLKAIDQLEGSARRYLDSQSVTFGGQHRANFRFVREALMLDTLIELNRYKTRYFEAIDAMLQQLPEHREAMRAKYPDQWELVKHHHDVSIAKIRSCYYFNYESLAMSVPKTVEGIGVDELLRRQNTRRAITEEYRREAQVVLAEQQQQARERVNEFVETTIRGFRSQVLTAFKQVSAKIKEGKPLIKTNIDTIHRVIDNVRALDFLNDSAFQSKLDEVKALVDNSTNLKDNTAAIKELEGLLNGTVDFVNSTTEATVMAKTKSYFARSLDLK